MPDTSVTSASALRIFLEEAVSAGVPGISAAVATRAGVVWVGTAGVTDLQTNIPVQPDVLFGIGSITKTFVAVVILQLVEEGCIDLQHTVSGLLGSAADEIPNADTATIAHLLNHTSGIPSWEDDPDWIRDGRGATLNVDRVWGKEDTLSYVKGRAPLASTGAQFSYANTNYTLLGMIIEKVSGNEVASEFRQRIINPLGLTDLYLEGFEELPITRLPRRYHVATRAFRNVAGTNPAFTEVRPDLIDVSASNLSVEWVAGGMVATARDLVLYGLALRDGRLLGPQTMKFVTDWRPIGQGEQIGHNLFRKEYPNTAVIIGHDGTVLGFSASLYWFEETDRVVALLCNLGMTHTGENPEHRCLCGKKREFVELAQRIASLSAYPGRVSLAED